VTTAYADWIAAFEQKCAARVLPEPCVATGVRGMCSPATLEMAAAFPELRRVRGHYDGREHWWCETPEGEVIDPTAAQFRLGGTYVEHTGPEPVGKCLICGGYVWTPYDGCKEACSEFCYTELVAEYGVTRYRRRA
jgi:hypothetical protein